MIPDYEKLERENQKKQIYENLNRIEDIAEKVSKKLINAEEGYNDSLIALSRISALARITKRYWIPDLYKEEQRRSND